MSRHYWFPLVIALAAAALPAQAGNPWTVSRDGERTALNITHATLGPAMNDVRLNFRQAGRLVPLDNWTLARSGANEFVVRTEQPRTAWRFAFDGNSLEISSTTANGVISAAVPAGRDRIPARLLDPEGAPVDWVGTSEVADGYGGSETHNRSFLPRHNPECMYFTLGRVPSPVFHSLFDRRSDTAIDFPEGTTFNEHGESLEVTIPVDLNAMVRVIPDYFTKTLGLPYYVRFDDSRFRAAPMVWSSWTSYYAAVREEDMVRNADWLAAHLKPYGFEYVQLDDGYDRGKNGEHYWIENWDREKFPHGPQWLAGYIKSKGLHPGIWIVPDAYAGAVSEHPDWYVRDKQGNIIRDYSTPALDSSNPEVLDFLKHLFKTLDDWGYEYYKFDGEHALPAYIPALDRQRLYDRSGPFLNAYRHRLEVIRDVIGPQRFIEGCPAGTPLNGIGYFNSYFNGADLYNNWQGMYPLFSSINANAFLNHLTVYVMPGEGLELGLPMTVEEALRKRPREVVDTARTREDPMTGFGTTAAEARTLVTYVALTGVAYPLASVMPELPEERVKLLKATMPTMPILPADLFSRGTDIRWSTFKHTQADFYIHNYPEILDLKINAAPGVYDVAGLTNWRSGKAIRNLDFSAKLGLDATRRYVVFDFWNQRLLGVFQNRIEVPVEPHDTRVLLVHPFLGRPQFLGTSRHITGAYSVSNVNWDGAARKLSGVADGVPGELYTVWIYVPQGVSLSGLRTSVKTGAVVPVERRISGNLLAAIFAGQKEPVAWEMDFQGASGPSQ
jgi:hypothetical protein